MQAIIDKTVLYQAAEWTITALVLLMGLPLLKQITTFVLTELYKFVVQQNFCFLLFPLQFRR